MDVSDFTLSTTAKSLIEEIPDRDIALELHLTDPVEILEEETNILAAAEIGHNRIITELISLGVDIQQKDHLGRTALHFAVQNGDLEEIEMLLKAGINPSVKDDVGMTPLMLCLMRNPSVKIAKLLFDYNALLLHRSSPMDTGIFIQFVMMCTPTEEDAEILKILVERGALVNDPKAPGQRQALHFAAMSNNCDLIKVLIELGADLYARNHRNETPREVAQIFNCKEAAALLNLIENQSYYDSEHVKKVFSDRLYSKRKHLAESSQITSFNNLESRTNLG